MLNPNHNLIKLSNLEYSRYCKQLILENIGPEGQKRLKKSKILVIGAGGLGCPIMIYLAASGIGYIGIVDQDSVELNNLNRQILYYTKEINKSKNTSAQKHLKKINNHCKIISHEYYLNRKNGFELISYYDIIIDTTDNFKTRYIIDEICQKLNKIHVYGAIESFESQIGIFNYKNGIRYENLYPIKSNIKYQNCNDNGIMGITAGYTGLIQATETIKIILGIGKISNNSIYICNLLDINIKEKKIYIKNKAMQININKQKKNEIKDTKIISQNTFKNLNKLMDQIIIIDIRKKNEFEKQHIKKSLNIPLIRFKINKTLKFIYKFSKERTIIIYCDTLTRSIVAANHLRQYNINYYIYKLSK
uniref:Molybdopterin biosynthesis protein n=1 Tax=Kuetzingia canaliculata TaxID=228262 RepID=A0A1Z1MQ24_KUECA|nr:Molybdopterin biosynthesis protein [Kuetzingia canaliculata]ARW67959.1 Molybdopterin biosynthesis protein [Kuetzingia canaliculata]